MNLRDLTPVLEDFITWDGRCAVCEYMMRGQFCLKKLRVVAKDDSCDDFKEKVKP